MCFRWGNNDYENTKNARSFEDEGELGQNKLCRDGRRVKEDNLDVFGLFEEMAFELRWRCAEEEGKKLGKRAKMMGTGEFSVLVAWFLLEKFVGDILGKCIIDIFTIKSKFFYEFFYPKTFYCSPHCDRIPYKFDLIHPYLPNI